MEFELVASTTLAVERFEQGWMPIRIIAPLDPLRTAEFRAQGQEFVVRPLRTFPGERFLQAVVHPEEVVVLQHRWLVVQASGRGRVRVTRLHDRSPKCRAPSAVPGGLLLALIRSCE